MRRKPPSIAACPRPSTATRSLASGRHIHELDAMPIQAEAALATMMHQIHLEVPWFADIPSDAPHGHADAAPD